MTEAVRSRESSTAPGSRKALSALDIAVLGLLVEAEMHPYEMFQKLQARRFDRIVKVRPGSVYHSVDRMAAAGLVRSTGTARAGNRPERTVYQVTDAGWDALQARIRELLATPMYECPSFPMALTEAHNLPGEEVIELLNQRIDLLNKEIADITGTLAWIRERGIPQLYSIGAQHGKAVRTAEVQWLRTLVADIGSGDLPWLYHGDPSQRTCTEAKDY